MATDICTALGARIRELRKAKGWRQIDLAQHSGVHEVHISDLERGSREVGIRTLDVLAKALDTTAGKHLDAYLGEFCWRYNRRYKQSKLFDMALSNLANSKPMPYKLLTDDGF